MAKVRGDQALLRNLRAASATPSASQVFDSICTDALVPLRDETNALAPRPSLKTGAVIRKRAIGSGRFVRVFWVAFRRGTPMRIAHLVELGTAPHSLYPGASRRKNLYQDRPPFHPGTHPEPFFRPAFEGTKFEVISTFGRRAWEVIVASIRGVRQ